MTWVWSYLRRNRRRQSVSKFASLIETPASGSFVMPAGAKLRFIATAGAIAGATAATLVGATDRTILTPVLAAGEYVVLDWVAAGVTVTPSAGYDCELDCGLGVWKKISDG